MKILVTGATGLVGSKLCKELFKSGAELVVIGRSKEESFRNKFTYPCEYLTWEALNHIPQVDGVIHLAGESIGDEKWTDAKKKSIIDSRVETAKNLAQAFKDKGYWPKVFISATAVGYYGDREDEVLTEESTPGNNFLAEVCKKWEASSSDFDTHCRVVRLRIGVVLDIDGGFLEPIEKIYSSGIGGPLGSGKQWMSWIHINDLIQLIHFSLNNNSISGTYNAVAPQPVTNKKWSSMYAKKLKAPNIMYTPAFALKIALGERAQLALASQNVSSKKIMNEGFDFQFKTVSDALNDLYFWKKTPSQKIFQTEQWVAKEKNIVFHFFSDANNLEKLIPPTLNFKILNQSTENIQQGTTINYKLNIHGVPINWRTKITHWEPPEKFCDEQLKGPYTYWRHTHEFETIKNGTLIKDQVIYELPLGKLGDISAGSFVKKDLVQIFNYRTIKYQLLLGSVQK